MRAFPRWFTLDVLALVVLFGFGGCNRNGGGIFGGNSSPTGNSRDQGGQKQQPQQKPGGGMNQSEPAGSVSGKPSADSDRGNSTAVGHRSVAQPGAPQGTAPQPPRQSAPKAPQP